MAQAAWYYKRLGNNLSLCSVSSRTKQMSSHKRRLTSKEWQQGLPGKDGVVCFGLTICFGQYHGQTSSEKGPEIVCLSL